MFGLERVQGVHNGHISNAGNVSASNDPVQQPNDANEQLIKSAGFAAAGETLGLSKEETLAAVSRKSRRQKQREAYESRNKRLAQWEQKQKTLQNEGFEVNQPDTDILGEDEVTAVFGETDYEAGFRTLEEEGQDYSPQDKETRVNLYQVQDGVKRAKVLPSGRKMMDIDKVRPEEEAFFRGDVAPKSALIDALQQLQGSTQTGAIDARERLTRQVQGGADLELMRFLSGELVEADAARFSPEMRAENDEYVRNLASYYAQKFTAGGPGSMADEAIGRIAEIRSLGGAEGSGSGVRSQC